jgi:colanic acid/amylovoran biosynthesis protein
MRGKEIIIINHCSTNKGDKAVLEYVLKKLRLTSDFAISVFASEPKYVPNHRDVEVFQWIWDKVTSSNSSLLARLIKRIFREIGWLRFKLLRRRLLKGNFSGIPFWAAPLTCRRRFRDANLIISTGGHHFTSLLEADCVSPQLYELMLAVASGTRTVLWSQSFGPFVFNEKKNEELVKLVLGSVYKIYVRDQKSFVELKRLSITANICDFTEDSVFGLLSKSDSRNVLNGIEKENPLLGISVYDVMEKSIEQQDRYVHEIAESLRFSAMKGYQVLFFPMQIEGRPSDDRPLIKRIIRTADLGDDAVRISPDFVNMETHSAAVSKCSIFLGHKTHSVVMALSAAVPILAIAYHSKTAEFMEKFHMSDYVINDDEFSIDWFSKNFERLIKNREKIVNHQVQVSSKLYAQVNADFIKMLNDAGVLENI